MASLPARPISFRKIQCIVFSVIWIGSSCVAEFNASSDLGELLERSGNRQSNFDFFMLSLLWPGTACLSSARCCPSNACCRRSSALAEFTIHGLWPDYNNGTWQACCPGAKFDIQEISPLLSTMNKYWPSFSCESVSNCHGGTGLFWEHEWEKHGPCSSPVIRDEYDYFVTALNLYFKYNVTPLKMLSTPLQRLYAQVMLSRNFGSASIRISSFGIVALISTTKVARLSQKVHVPFTSAYRNISRWMLKTKKSEDSQRALKWGHLNDDIVYCPGPGSISPSISRLMLALIC